MTDWGHIRSIRFTKERPADWPEGVFGVSLEGVALLGVHEQSGKLYWDGKEIVTRNWIRLGTYERWIGFFAALGTFGTFAVNIGRSAGWWM
jgi:hypothetical protein